MQGKVREWRSVGRDGVATAPQEPGGTREEAHDEHRRDGTRASKETDLSNNHSSPVNGSRTRAELQRKPKELKQEDDAGGRTSRSRKDPDLPLKETVFA